MVILFKKKIERSQNLLFAMFIAERGLLIALSENITWGTDHILNNGWEGYERKLTRRTEQNSKVLSRVPMKLIIMYLKLIISLEHLHG